MDFDFGFRISDRCGLRSLCGSPTRGHLDFGLWISGFGLWILEICGFGFRIWDFGFLIWDCGFWISDSGSL